MDEKRKKMAETAKEYIDVFGVSSTAQILYSHNKGIKERAVLEASYAMLKCGLERYKLNLYSNNYRKLHHIPMRRRA